MRTTPILLVALFCLPAAADDDGYYRRQLEQRQYEQRQFEQRQEASRLETQRLQNQQAEAQRVEQERQRRETERRRQDRVDQAEVDERWSKQQQQRLEVSERSAAAQRRNSDALMQQSLALGLRGGSKKQSSRRQCSELLLPRDEAAEPTLTGYFAVRAPYPHFQSSLQLGPQGTAGWLVFTAFVKDGELPTQVNPLRVEMKLSLRQAKGDLKQFKAISGTARFSVADANPDRGRFEAEVDDLVLVEMDGVHERVGGSCLVASTFRISARWSP